MHGAAAATVVGTGMPSATCPPLLCRPPSERAPAFRTVVSVAATGRRCFELNFLHVATSYPSHRRLLRGPRFCQAVDLQVASRVACFELRAWPRRSWYADRCTSGCASNELRLRLTAPAVHAVPRLAIGLASQ